MASCNKVSKKVSSNSIVRFQRSCRLEEGPPWLKNYKVHILQQETPKMVRMEKQNRRCTVALCNKESVKVSLNSFWRFQRSCGLKQGTDEGKNG